MTTPPTPGLMLLVLMLEFELYTENGRGVAQRDAPRVNSTRKSPTKTDECSEETPRPVLATPGGPEENCRRDVCFFHCWWFFHAWVVGFGAALVTFITCF